MEHEHYQKLKDAVCGCLFGGAIGDALGYPVEFMSLDKIKFEYGDEGITEFDMRGTDKAQISDDTQMTLFTANGLLYGQTRARLRGIAGPLSSYVFKAYEEWYNTQLRGLTQSEAFKTCWIYNVEVLHNSRAPGSTCMSAIANSNGEGSPDNPINDSKGCGGVMRIAPIACFAACGHFGSKKSVAEECANVAALTHGHPLGYISAAFLGCMIYLIIKSKIERENTLEDIISESMNVTKELYGSNVYFQEFENIILKAVELSNKNIENSDAINQLGQGWVAEEATAIAIYSILKHRDNFMNAVICAVNHDGDSDSTGSIAGNILGAYLGLSIVDYTGDKLINIEAYEVIYELANDLVSGCEMTEYGEYNDVKWNSKYVTISYGK